MNRHPDLSFAAMILAVGLLFAWAYASVRDSSPLDMGSGLLPINADHFERSHGE